MLSRNRCSSSSKAVARKDCLRISASCSSQLLRNNATSFSSSTTCMLPSDSLTAAVFFWLAASAFRAGRLKKPFCTASAAGRLDAWDVSARAPGPATPTFPPSPAAGVFSVDVLVLGVANVALTSDSHCEASACLPWERAHSTARRHSSSASFIFCWLFSDKPRSHRAWALLKSNCSTSSANSFTRFHRLGISVIWARDTA
mmetsp:Transcript_9982/g.23998  ORF Transcript_9982/g.23998 Transcript_9982/m.23998 type:complete len:201 (+) Transcript_9982:563-1165(+)